MRLIIPVLTAIAISPTASYAESEGTNQVEEVITVVGTRTERALSDVAATITVKTSDDIERELARNISDLVRLSLASLSQERAIDSV